MTLNEIRALKSFPKGTQIVRHEESAVFTVEKYVVRISPAGKDIMEYKGHISYVYANGKTYDKYFRGRGFQKVLKDTIEYFEFRNKQMDGYKK